MTKGKTGLIFTLIENGRVYAPEPLGITSILLLGERIVAVGAIDMKALAGAGMECQVIDAAGCVVLPGLIDPHQHLIGAGGEHGFNSRLPEIPLEQIVQCGITTAVGLLGTDTVTRDPRCLYAKVQQLNQDGLTAYMYTGGFELPPRTVTTSVVDDLVFIDPIIGTGEIALSDSRWIDPPLEELAHVVAQTYLGGMMAGKAGVTHFHIGSGRNRLGLLRDLLNSYEIPAEAIYVTHITRSMELLREAVELAKGGAFVDMDSVEQNIPECLRAYQQQGGDLKRLTVSSDAQTPGGSPQKFLEALVTSLQDGVVPLETLLPCFTTNAADILKLKRKGRIQENHDADVVILRDGSWEVVHVFANGQHFVRDGRLIRQSQQQRLLQEGNV
ncbi:MAG: amidohydrolase family protein [bacterium]|nr:amidohydrolase family protein [bacterium]